MKLSKKQKRLSSERLLIAVLILMTTLTGCARTSAKTVKIDSFCTGKYEPLTSLNKEDFDNIAEMRIKENHRLTWNKFIDHLTINEKEFKICNAKSN